MTEVYRAGDIKALLALRYAAPEYAFFTEVANGTGARQAGFADGLAYGLYPSTGHPIHGFEIKVSRSDWLRELKKPAKAGHVMQYCDKWWLVAPKGVAHLEEIPKAWGFFEIINDRFYTRKHAPDLTPQPLSPSFIAAMLRRATENTVPKSTLKEQVARAEEQIKARYENDITDAKTKLEAYKQSVQEWEKASGLRVLDTYQDKKALGEIVAWVLKGGLRHAMIYKTGDVIRQLNVILKAMQDFEALSKEFPDLPPEIKQHTNARWDRE